MRFELLINFKRTKKGLPTWQQTRKMNNVIAVHSTFSLNWICKKKAIIFRETWETLSIYFPISIWPHGLVHVPLVLAKQFFFICRQKLSKKRYNSTDRQKRVLRCLLEPFTTKLTFLSGFETSGKTEMNGRKTSRNLTVWMRKKSIVISTRKRAFSLKIPTLTKSTVFKLLTTHFYDFFCGQKLKSLQNEI